MLRGAPTPSARPVLEFAFGRLCVTLVGLGAMLLLSVPEDGLALAVVAAVAIGWASLVLAVTLRNPRRGESPLVALGDFAVLMAIELLAPETYGGVRFAALFLTAAHAHVQGERLGLLIGAIGAGSLVTATALSGDAPLSGDVLTFYEAGFVICSLASGVIVGRLRTAESASRLRALALTRRTLQAESEVRRRVAEAIHVGPVQELIGLEMILLSASKAAAEGRNDDAERLLDDARQATERSVRSLRDEIVDLGPASQELAFDTAIAHCVRVWKQRYGFEVMLTVEDLDLPGEVAGELFRIAQEAVVNAGRHAEASGVSISLRSVDSTLELRVTDDGHGFDANGDLLRVSKAGHIGLASMRERAELLRGELDIESSERGTRVLVRLPLPESTPHRNL
jgi:signal transduction histidine kinase